MAIPTGTTVRQLAALARWTLLGTVVLSPLAWWRPGYLGWGAAIVAVLTVLAAWLVLRIVAGANHVPGHPLHMALLGPVVILAYHLVAAPIRGVPVSPYSLAGGVSVSLVFQFALLSAVVMLTQSLFRVEFPAHRAPLPTSRQTAEAEGRGTWRLMIALAVLGAAIMGGVAAAVNFGQASSMKVALGLLALAGAAIWLVPLRHLRSTVTSGESGYSARFRDLRIAYLGVPVIAAVSVTCSAPRAAVITIGVAAMALMAACVPMASARKTLLAGGLALAAAGTIVLAAMPVSWAGYLSAPHGLEGLGEQALSTLDLTARSSALSVLGGITGWAGLGWLLAGLLISFAVLLAQADERRVGVAQVILWAMAMLLSMAALLAGGGLFAPVFTLVAGFVWGLAPAMLGLRFPGHAHENTCAHGQPRSGLFLLLGMLILTAAMGVVHNDGLLVWAVADMGGNDKYIHGAAGLLLTLALAWYFGGRRILFGSISIALGGLLGGLGELLQGLASRRGMEWGDWGAHSIGAGVAACLYFLVLGCRLAESPEARDKRAAEQKYLEDPHPKSH